MTAGAWDWVLGVIIAAFVGWEVTARWVLHNRTGHTLSNLILLFIRAGGWPARCLVGAATIALAVHLQGIF